MFMDPDVTEYVHYKCMTGDHYSVANILYHSPSKVHCLDGRLSVPPLFYACRYGHVKVCRVLLDADADIAFSRQGWTALHEACSFNHVDIVRLLLERGANPNATVSWSGMTPLMHAARRNFLGVCKALIGDGGGGDTDVWQRNLDGKTALELTDNVECQDLCAREMKKVLLRQAWKANRVTASTDFLAKYVVGSLPEELLQEVISYI